MHEQSSFFMKMLYWRMKRVLLLICCCLLLLPGPLRASDFRFSPKPNKAHLIQWRAWGQDSLEEAKKQDRLVLLSLSAIWCHWCHVMDETTYSNEEIIAFINDHFIPIRVDSDMRPDIDTLYNQGGWPSTVIMTPQGEVLTGGTYIPPDDMLGRLKRIADIFENDRGTITAWRKHGPPWQSATVRGGRKVPGSPACWQSSPSSQTLMKSMAVWHRSEIPSPNQSIFFLRGMEKGILRPGVSYHDLDRMARGSLMSKAGSFAMPRNRTGRNRTTKRY
jgi:hypothetical protein